MTADDLAATLQAALIEHAWRPPTDPCHDLWRRLGAALAAYNHPEKEST